MTTPARDTAATLGAQLQALIRQNVNEWWEVIVIDTSSSGGTADVV